MDINALRLLCQQAEAEERQAQRAFNTANAELQRVKAIADDLSEKWRHAEKMRHWLEACLLEATK